MLSPSSPPELGEGVAEEEAGVLERRGIEAHPPVGRGVLEKPAGIEVDRMTLGVEVGITVEEKPDWTA